jgi:hypothetical protein
MFPASLLPAYAASAASAVASAAASIVGIHQLALAEREAALRLLC